MSASTSLGHGPDRSVKLDKEFEWIRYRVVGGMGALLATPAARAGGWAAGVRAPTAADGGITTGHALIGGCGGSCMQLSGPPGSCRSCAD